MWTPRRIALLMLGVLGFSTCYIGYAHSNIGVIDGLPTLPEQFREKSDGVIPPLPSHSSRVVQKLIQAYGPDADELKRPVKLELNSKGMVLAASAPLFEGGRVILSPVSVAIFGKERFDGKGLEINTVRANIAYLSFDRPVWSLQEINGRKIVAAELRDHIEITNNRRTPDRGDDLVLSIAHGPVWYEESKHLMWTEDDVSIRDKQSRPEPMKIDGKGMEVELAAETAAKPNVPPTKSKSDSISGVKRIAIKSDVVMILYVDSHQSGMPGGDRQPGKSVDPAASAAKPAALSGAAAPGTETRAQLVIKSPGRFNYGFGKDYDEATFDVMPIDAKTPSPTPQFVTVDRNMPSEESAEEGPPEYKLEDHVECKHLELQLRRKGKDAAPPPATASRPARDDNSLDQGLEIEHARATGGYKEVTLTSNSEKLYAQCNELIHDAGNQLTILRGQPEMEANRDGNIIYAPELEIKDHKVVDPSKAGAPAKTYQTVRSPGPGRVELVDQKTHKVNKAFWNDLLTSKRQEGPDFPELRGFDLLELTGAARLVDPEQGSTLQGDVLKIWLKPHDAEPDPTARLQPANAQPGPRPERLEVLGHVRLASAQLNVHDTSRLTVTFQDGPPTVLPPPAPAALPSTPAKPPVQPEQPPREKPKPGSLDPPPPVAEKRQRVDPPSATAGTGPPPAPTDRPPGTQQKIAPAAKKDEPPRPMDLSAVSVAAVVLRGAGPDGKNQLKTLDCSGFVKVHQDPDLKKPDDKGLEITGSTLNVKCYPEGNNMDVAADDVNSKQDLAELQTGNLYIIGPRISVNQVDNTAHVNGRGAMMTETAGTVGGTKKDKPVPITIHWTDSMLFTGKSAIFHGDIQAEQTPTGTDEEPTGRLTCETLTAYFDREISLKEGDKGAEPAKIKKMVCDRSVMIDDKTMEPDPKTGKIRLGKFQRITGTTVVIDVFEKEEGEQKETNEINGSGPGLVVTIKRGGADPMAAPAPNGQPKPPPKPEAEEELKLTYVEYEKRLQANTKTGKAKFWGVRLLQKPWDEKALLPREINLDEEYSRLPKGALYLTSEQLEVISQKTPQGKNRQELTATGSVYVKTNEFYAICDEMHYDEGKDQIIFRARDNNLATLAQYLHGPTSPPEKEIKGKVIIYIRGTGAMRVDGATTIGTPR